MDGIVIQLNPDIGIHSLAPDKTDVICIGRDIIIYYIPTNNKYGNTEKQKLESIEK